MTSTAQEEYKTGRYRKHLLHKEHLLFRNYFMAIAQVRELIEVLNK